MNKNKIARWLARNALLLASVVLLLLAAYFYLDVESRRAEAGLIKEKNVSVDGVKID
jgi:hypothetical protein